MATYDSSPGLVQYRLTKLSGRRHGVMRQGAPTPLDGLRHSHPSEEKVSNEKLRKVVIWDACQLHHESMRINELALQVNDQPDLFAVLLK